MVERVFLFKEGGVLWFIDFMIVDLYFIFFIMSGFFIFVIIEVIFINFLLDYFVL